MGVLYRHCPRTSCLVTCYVRVGRLMPASMEGVTPVSAARSPTPLHALACFVCLPPGLPGVCSALLATGTHPVLHLTGASRSGFSSVRGAARPHPSGLPRVGFLARLPLAEVFSFQRTRRSSIPEAVGIATVPEPLPRPKDAVPLFRN